MASEIADSAIAPSPTAGFHGGSVFAHVVQAPEDPILGVIIRFVAMDRWSEGSDWSLLVLIFFLFWSVLCPWCIFWWFLAYLTEKLRCLSGFNGFGTVSWIHSDNYLYRVFCFGINRWRLRITRIRVRWRLIWVSELTGPRQDIWDHGFCRSSNKSFFLLACCLICPIVTGREATCSERGETSRADAGQWSVWSFLFFFFSI